MRRTTPTRRWRRNSMIGVVAAGLAMTGLAAVTATGAPARPGTPAKVAAAPVPAAPTVVFTEDFENGQPRPAPPEPAGVTMLDDYTGAAPLAMTYDGAPYWIDEDACNGVILSNAVTTRPVAPVVPVDFCTDQGWTALRSMANALGVINGAANPGTNHAVAAWTDGGGAIPGGADQVQLHTENPITVPSGRFYTTSIDSVGTTCGGNHPQLKFYLLPDNIGPGVATFDTPIDPCADGDALGSGFVGGRFVSNKPALIAASTLGLELRDGSGQRQGNDSAFDNIQLIDVTPQLNKEFAPGALPGQPSTLTFMIVNTSELAAKTDFGFTDTLPAGVVISATPAAATTCGNGVVGAIAGGNQISLTGGDLATGDDACTVTLNVTAANAGSYVNSPNDVTTTGLIPPGPAQLLVGTPFTCPTSKFFLAQDTDTFLTSGVAVPGGYNFTPIGGPVGFGYNAIAYNPADNFIYGSHTVTAPNIGHLVRIDATGAVIDLGVTSPSPMPSVNSGAIDGLGNFYGFSSGGGGVLQKVNLATMTRSVIALSSNAALPSDASFIAGQLWGQQGADLVRIDPGGTVTRFTQPAGTIPASAGAAWTFGNGNLGLSNNPNGDIFQIKITNPTSATPTFTLISKATGPVAVNNANDGTSCNGQDVNLGIVKTALPSPAAPGAPITYTLTVTNSGPGDSSGFVVSDTAPAGLTNLATPPGQGCAFAGQVLTCNKGPLANGGVSVITYSGVAPNSPAPLNNSATVTGNENDPTPGNNTSTLVTPMITPTSVPTPTPAVGGVVKPPKADLAMVVDGPSKVTPGGSVPLTLKVTNKGPGKSTGEIVKYTLPKGIGSAKVSYPKGVKCSFSGRQLICELGSLGSGKSLTIKLTGKVASNAKGTIHTGARVSGKNDPNKNNNKDSVEIQVVQPQARPVTRPAPYDPCAAAASRGYAVGMPGGDC